MSNQGDPRLRAQLELRVARVCGRGAHVGNYEFDRKSYRVVRSSEEGSAEFLTRIPEAWIAEGAWDQVEGALREAMDLRARWDQLIRYVLGEYSSHNQSPALNFEEDFENRKVRLRVAFSRDEWISRTLTDEELRSGDLLAIARELYMATRPGPEAGDA